jgi:hypothetical protein
MLQALHTHAELVAISDLIASRLLPLQLGENMQPRDSCRNRWEDKVCFSAQMTECDMKVLQDPRATAHQDSALLTVSIETVSVHDLTVSLQTSLQTIADDVRRVQFSSHMQPTIDCRSSASILMFAAAACIHTWQVSTSETLAEQCQAATDLRQNASLQRTLMAPMRYYSSSIQVLKHSILLNSW